MQRINHDKWIISVDGTTVAKFKGKNGTIVPDEIADYDGWAIESVEDVSNIETNTSVLSDDERDLLSLITRI